MPHRRHKATFTAIGGVTVALSDAGVKTIAEARLKEVIIGSSGAGSISALLPAAHNTFAGTKFRFVQGYEGAAHMNLSIVATRSPPPPGMFCKTTDGLPRMWSGRRIDMRRA